MNNVGTFDNFLGGIQWFDPAGNGFEIKATDLAFFTQRDDILIMAVLGNLMMVFRFQHPQTYECEQEKP